MMRREELSGAVLALGIVVCTAAGVRAEEAKADFRNKRFDDGWLQMVGSDPGKYLQMEEEGLRIRYPAGDPPKDAHGVAWRCRIDGDFTVSALFEILHADATAQGTGVELYLMLQNENREGLPIARLTRTAEGRCFTFSHMIGPAQGRKANGWMAIPAAPAGERGWLRLQRQGNVVVGSKAEGDDGQFEEINRFDVGDFEVISIMLRGLLPKNSKNASLDARLLEFQLRGKLIGLPPSAIAPVAAAPDDKAAPEPAAEQAVRWPLVIVLGLGGAFVALALATAGLVAVVRIRRSAGRTHFIALACDGCGRKLEVKPELAGKKVKCGQCGKVVRVPWGHRPD